MPSKSKKQAKFMAAAANSPEFARKVGISQETAKEWHAHDKAEGRFLKSLAEAMEKAKKPAKGPSKDPTLPWHEVPLDDGYTEPAGILSRHSTDARSTHDPDHWARYEIDQLHPEVRAAQDHGKEYEVWHFDRHAHSPGHPQLLSAHDSLDEAKAAAHKHNFDRTIDRHVTRHYGLKPHEVEAVNRAWPGEGVKRFHGQHPDMVRHEVDRALGAMEKMFAGHGRYRADLQYHADQARRLRRSSTIAHHGFNEEQVNALEHAHGSDALERFHPDKNLHPDMVRSEVSRAVKHYREYAPHNVGAVENVGAEPDVSNIKTPMPKMPERQPDLKDPSTWFGNKAKVLEAAKQAKKAKKVEKSVKDLRQDVIRAKRRAEPGSALNATLRYIAIEAKNRRNPRQEVVDKTPEMLDAERATVPGRPAPADVRTHFEQYPASWQPYLKKAEKPVKPFRMNPRQSASWDTQEGGEWGPWTRHFGKLNDHFYEIDEPSRDRSGTSDKKSYTVWHHGNWEKNIPEDVDVGDYPTLSEAHRAVIGHRVAKHYGLSHHEQKAVEHAWPEGTHRFIGAHPDRVKHEVARAVAAYPHEDEPVEKARRPFDKHAAEQLYLGAMEKATKFDQKAKDVLRDVKANVSTGQKRPSGERSMRGSGKSPMRAEPGNSLFAVGEKKSTKLAGLKGRRAYQYGGHWTAVTHHPEHKVVVINAHEYGGSTKLMIDTLRREIPKEFPGHHLVEVHHPHAQTASELTNSDLKTVHSYLKEAAAKHPEEERRRRAAEDVVKLNQVFERKRG